VRCRRTLRASDPPLVPPCQGRVARAPLRRALPDRTPPGAPRRRAHPGRERSPGGRRRPEASV